MSSVSTRSLPQPGETWQHFKGNIYTIIGIAKDAETEEQHVVYKSLDGIIWMRPLDNFMQVLGDKDGTNFYRFELTKFMLVGSIDPEASFRFHWAEGV